MSQKEKIGCDTEEWETLWRRWIRVDHIESGDKILYALRWRTRTLYVGQTTETGWEYRLMKHFTDNHNESLGKFLSANLDVKMVRITTCTADRIDALEQSGIAILRMLSEEGFNVVRGGSFNESEQEFFDLYIGRKVTNWNMYRGLVHGILPEGLYTLKLLGFYENHDRAVMAFQDCNGWTYFNVCPKNNVYYSQRNAERIERWNRWRKWTGNDVDVKVRVVDGGLLQSEIIRTNVSVLSDGRRAIIKYAQECQDSFKSFVERRKNLLQSLRRP